MSIALTLETVRPRVKTEEKSSKIGVQGYLVLKVLSIKGLVRKMKINQPRSLMRKFDSRKNKNQESMCPGNQLK